MLLTAFWEAYCEELVAEALEHSITYGKDASTVPEELRKQSAEGAPGPAAGDGDGFIAMLMSAEAEALCNAPYGVVSAEPVNRRKRNA